MKYIRTDTEIYATDDLYVCEELNGKPYATKDGGWCIYRESIVKEANTIEELCDAYVVVYKDGNCYLEYDCEKAKEIRKGITGILKVKEVYGALVTDKSINYIAKMNKEGELELL